MCCGVVSSVLFWSEGLSDLMSSAQKWFERIMDAPVLAAVRSIILTVVGFKLFSFDFTKSVGKILGRSEKTDILTGVKTIFADIIVIIRSGEAMIKGASFSEIMTAGDPIRVLAQRVEDLLREADHLVSGRPVEGCMSVRTFVTLGTGYLKDGAILLEGSRTAYGKYKYLKDQLILLRHQITAAKARLAGKTRSAPIFVVVQGDPGIGKSKVIEYVQAKYCQVIGEEFTQDRVFPMNETDEFREGYEPFSTDIIKVPEFANKPLQYVAARGDAFLAEICAIIQVFCGRAGGQTAAC